MSLKWARAQSSGAGTSVVVSLPAPTEKKAIRVHAMIGSQTGFANQTENPSISITNINKAVGVTTTGRYGEEEKGGPLVGAGIPRLTRGIRWCSAVGIPILRETGTDITYFCGLASVERELLVGYKFRG